MQDRLPYHPEIDLSQIQGFDACIERLPGSWTITRSFVHGGDLRVIRPRWIIASEPWGDIPGWLAFLDRREHRALLRCFLQREAVTPALRTSLVRRGMPEEEVALLSFQDAHRLWSADDLLRHMGPLGERSALEPALHFLHLQEMIEAWDSNTWHRGPQLKAVANLFATFEWIVQERLQRFHHAFARRCVSFQEWQTPSLNDLDVLAFIDDLVLFVECKSSTDITPEQLARFVQRATTFPATLALLLIDTASETQIAKRLRQINSILGRESTEMSYVHNHHGSLIVQLAGTLWIANTAGGIAASLEGTLHLRAALQGAGGATTG